MAKLNFNWISDFSILTDTPILKDIITAEQYNHFKKLVDNYCYNYNGTYYSSDCSDTSYSGSSGQECGTNDSSTGYSSVLGIYYDGNTKEKN